MAAEGKAAEVVPNTATVSEVAEWLRTYDDGDWADLAETFKGVRGRHLHGYSEAQLKEFCGGPRGAALYNVLHRELRPPPIAVAWPRLLCQPALLRRARTAPPAFGDLLGAATDMRRCAARRRSPPDSASHIGLELACGACRRCC